MPNIRMLSARREMLEKEKLKHQGTVKARRDQEMDTQDVAKKTNTSESARTAKKALRDAKLAESEEKIAREKMKTAKLGQLLGGIGALVGIVGTIGNLMMNSKKKPDEPENPDGPEKSKKTKKSDESKNNKNTEKNENKEVKIIKVKDKKGKGDDEVKDKEDKDDVKEDKKELKEDKKVKESEVKSEEANDENSKAKNSENTPQNQNKDKVDSENNTPNPKAPANPRVERAQELEKRKEVAQQDQAKQKQTQEYANLFKQLMAVTGTAQIQSDVKVSSKGKGGIAGNLAHMKDVAKAWGDASKGVSHQKEQALKDVNIKIDNMTILSGITPGKNYKDLEDKDKQVAKENGVKFDKNGNVDKKSLDEAKNKNKVTQEDISNLNKAGVETDNININEGIVDTTSQSVLLNEQQAIQRTNADAAVRPASEFSTQDLQRLAVIDQAIDNAEQDVNSAESDISSMDEFDNLIDDRDALQQAINDPSKIESDSELKEKLEKMGVLKDGKLDTNAANNKLTETNKSIETNQKALQDSGVKFDPASGKVSDTSRNEANERLSLALNTVSRLNEYQDQREGELKGNSRDESGGSSKRGGLLRLLGISAGPKKAETEDELKNSEIKKVKKNFRGNKDENDSNVNGNAASDTDGLTKIEQNAISMMDGSAKANRTLDKLSKESGISRDELNKYFDTSNGQLTLKNNEYKDSNFIGKTFGMIKGNFNHDSDLARAINKGTTNDGKDGGISADKAAKLLSAMNKDSSLQGLAGNVIGNLSAEKTEEVLGKDTDFEKTLTNSESNLLKEMTKDGKIDENDIKNLTPDQAKEYDSILKKLGIDPTEENKANFTAINSALAEKGGGGKVINNSALANMLQNSGLNQGQIKDVVKNSGKSDDEQKDIRGGAKKQTGSGERASIMNMAILGLNASMPAIQFYLQQLDKMREAQDQLNEAKKKKEAAYKLLGEVAKDLKRTQEVVNQGSGAGTL